MCTVLLRGSSSLYRELIVTVQFSPLSGINTSYEFFLSCVRISVGLLYCCSLLLLLHDWTRIHHFSRLLHSLTTTAGGGAGGSIYDRFGVGIYMYYLYTVLWLSVRLQSHAQTMNTIQFESV